ncbi:MAG: lipoyl(octanoyl) transferase LipB [Acidobacteriota bacterium]
MADLCEVRPLHLVTYENGMAMQETLVLRRQEQSIPDQLLLLQHPPVITLGRGGDSRNLLASPESLERQGIRFYETTRGGDITYHGPGQIVGYPILHLGEGRRDVRKYVTRLEEVLIRTAARFGIFAERIDGRRGIWVGNDKLAAIGVRIARWVTSHGFAFNVRTELSHFRTITPCGLSGTGVTSLERLLGRTIEPDEVLAVIIEEFAEVFDRRTSLRGHDMQLVKVALHDGAGHIALFHRKDHDFWQPVTGRIEHGETPAGAAAREVREEAGCNAQIESLGLRQSFLIEPEFIAEASAPVFADERSYSARIDPAITLKTDPEEHDRYDWFTFEKAYATIRWTDDRETIECLERSQSLPGSGGAPESGAFSGRTENGVSEQA